MLDSTSSEEDEANMSLIRKKQLRMESMDSATRDKLHRFKKIREAKRQVYNTLRDESSSDESRSRRYEQRMRNTNETAFTALYSGSVKTSSPGQLRSREASNRQSFRLKVGQTSKEYVIKDYEKEEDNYSSDILAASDADSHSVI